MKRKRRNRLQYEGPDVAEEQRKAQVRAVRDAFLARRRGEVPAEPEPAVATVQDESPVAPSVAQPAVKVPPDWRGLHWKKRVAIAKQCYPGFEFINGGQADEAIARYLGA